MGTHYNPSISERYVRIFNPKFDYNADLIADVIQPVVLITPRINIIRNGNRTTTGTTTLLTTDSAKDTYISALTVSFQKDVNCDLVNANVTATIEGVSRSLAQVATLALAADSKVVSINFPVPIKIDRNTGITFTTTFTVGACSSSVVIYGYTEEVTK